MAAETVTLDSPVALASWALEAGPLRSWSSSARSLMARRSRGVPGTLSAWGPGLVVVAVPP